MFNHMCFKYKNNTSNHQLSVLAQTAVMMTEGEDQPASANKENADRRFSPIESVKVEADGFLE